ncbi:MAG TPA: metallophosphoesterase family protein [bacterium]|nr:metallophosphoesterase family protein [bacterium]
MKIIIFSDIHANIDAFKAFLEIADGMEYERMYNLGDTVGYGAAPDECVQEIISRNIPSVTGNHDDVVLGRYEPSRFNPDARRAIMWCRTTMDQGNLDFLRAMNDFIWIDSNLGKALLVHGSPVDKDEYLMTKNNAERAFTAMMEQDISISFVGHTHKPCCWIQDVDGTPIFRQDSDCEENFQLNPALKVIVNVGSIGQSRDGNYQGCFVIWDDVRHTITFKRFDYPLETAKKRIIETGLPSILADRLQGGY